MTRTRFRLAALLLPLAMLAGCRGTQPVAETTARAVVTQLPGSFDQMGARRDCREHAAAAHGQATEATRTAALDREVEDYQAMVEAALVYRAETLRLVERIKWTMDRREPIAGSDLAELNAAVCRHAHRS